MATILQTPVLNPITPFDPTQQYAITFTYDDNQAVRSRARIILNTTGDVVYDETQNITSGLQHKVPANTLTVGNQYTVQIQVFDVDGNSSNLSDPILFYCFTKPTFSLDLDVINGTIIETTSLALNLTYSQSEDEPLKSVQFMKYSYDGTPLSSSSVLYTSASTTSYTFYSLDNETSYYFRAVGETSHGISLDTGYIEVTVQFEDNPLVVAFDVENIYKQGYISIATNIKDVEYELENDNYRFENGMLILEDNWLEYSNGINVQNDFSLYVDAYSVKSGTFLTTNDNVFSLSIEEVCDTYYGTLSVGDFKQYVALPNAYLVDGLEDNNTSNIAEFLLRDSIYNGKYDTTDITEYKYQITNGVAYDNVVFYFDYSYANYDCKVYRPCLISKDVLSGYAIVDGVSTYHETLYTNCYTSSSGQTYYVYIPYWYQSDYVNDYMIYQSTFNDNAIMIDMTGITTEYSNVVTMLDVYENYEPPAQPTKKFIRLSSDESTVTFEVKRINGYYNLSVYDKATQ